LQDFSAAQSSSQHGAIALVGPVRSLLYGLNLKPLLSEKSIYQRLLLLHFVNCHPLHDQLLNLLVSFSLPNPRLNLPFLLSYLVPLLLLLPHLMSEVSYVI